MIQQDMTAALRQDFGKGAARQLRLSGHAPGILYGGKMEPIALAMDTKSLTRDLLKFHGHNVVLSLDIEGDKSKKKHYVLIKDIQTDPIQMLYCMLIFLKLNWKRKSSWRFLFCIPELQKVLTWAAS